MLGLAVSSAEQKLATKALVTDLLPPSPSNRNSRRYVDLAQKLRVYKMDKKTK